MAPRQIKMPEQAQIKMPEQAQIKMPEQADEQSTARHSQRKRPEIGRFLLQVDRQTKGSYPTAETASIAGLAIKKGFPLVHVSIYDSVETLNSTIELPESS